jgi:hypothetical protein
MKTKRFAVSFVLILIWMAVYQQNANPQTNAMNSEIHQQRRPISIDWDQSTSQFVTVGGYGRVKKSNNGELALVYSVARSDWIRKSNDMGDTWSNRQLVCTQTGYKLVNAELIQLENGNLLYAFNGRPEQDNTNLPYTINTIMSEDNGRTWGNPQVIYSAGVTFANGCWEPAMLQLPGSGEIQLFFANEFNFPNTNEQEITLLRSFDGGHTWGGSQRVSFRAGRRDGMPVPLYLKKNKGIVFAIEDNGYGRFKPAIIYTSNEENWYHGYVVNQGRCVRMLQC